MTEASYKSSTGLQPNIVAGLSYLAFIVTGLVFYLLEKADDHVRFHAMQSIFVSVAIVIVWFVLSIASTILAFIPIIGVVIKVQLFLAFVVCVFILWLILLIKAFQGQRYHLPFIGEMAEKYSKGS